MSLNTESAEFLAVILQGDRADAHRLVRRWFEARSLTYLYEHVICPAMREVGELWSADRITVADEHLATATASAAVASLYPDVQWPVTRSSRVLVACPQGEQHAFGARMLADLLALDGWDEIYFGADVPLDALSRKVAELQPQVVALSVTLRSHVATAREAALRVRAASPGTRIVLGGRAAMRSPEVATEAGADLSARSAAEAVERIREWRG